MQTSSRIERDNWIDFKVINIRPIGEYTLCPCCRHKLYKKCKQHHCNDCSYNKCHYHCDCDDCEFTGSYIKPEHGCHCHHQHPPVPCPPHHCDCHDPHLFPIDQDGDGFVESDMIHKHPESYIPEPLPDEIGDKEDDTTTITDDNDEVNDNIDTTNYYGQNLVVSVPREIQPVETSDEIDSILDEDTTDDMVTTDEDGYHTLTDEVPVEEDNWETSKMIDTDTQEIVEETPVPEQELKEVETVPSVETVEEKPTRGRRRVNRGGRRKKEE